MKSLLKVCSIVWMSLLLCSVALAQAPSTQPSVSDEAKHAELRALYSVITDANNRCDTDAVLPHLHPEIIYTPQDATPLRGHAAIKAYSDKMTKGPKPLVQSLTVKPTLDRPAIFFSENTAVASGSSEDEFKLTDGRIFRLHSRWTTSLVRVDGRWLVTSLHISDDLFDNAILDMLKQSIVKAGLLGFGIGMVVSGVFAWMFRKRTKTAV